MIKSEFRNPFLSVYVRDAIKSLSPWYPSSFQLKKTISTIYLATLTIASSSSKTTWLPGILQDKFFTTVCFFLHCCLQRLKKLLLLQPLRLVLLHSFELWITGYTVPLPASLRKINFSLEEMKLVLQKISAHFQVLQGTSILMGIQQNMT